ncbi:putative quinol monooxygenase [Nostoc punctiforme UO1]|uniref:putative quinol monooxygenase n=1 Tax=Nostoc punctiforme TaxID=272131 RepID=UPI0030A5834E
MKQFRIHNVWLVLSAFLMLTLFSCQSTLAEKNDRVVRLARLEIYPAYLESYKALLKEEIETSVRVEPGVLGLNAVSEKDHPTRITILEIYANEQAYQAHIKSPHFQKYKTSTPTMIKSLDLAETNPILLGTKAR